MIVPCICIRFPDTYPPNWIAIVTNTDAIAEGITAVVRKPGRVTAESNHLVSGHDISNSFL